jgi:stage II sporulation protein AA (anti-sigma F factor antagonist)
MDAAANWEQGREGAAYVLRIKGDVDLSNSHDLQRAIERLCRRAREEMVVIDLADVRFIDSSGLRALYDGTRRASSPVRLRNPAPHVQRVLEIALPGCFAVELDMEAGG